MPKIVDAEARRQEIAEAVFRVVRRDGLEQASLRLVAAEAGLVVGSVRHYFATHDELIVFAMRTLSERVRKRLLVHAERLLDPAGPPVDRLELTERLLGELLPLDDTRRAETEVWLAFTAAARTRPELAGDVTRSHDEIRAVTRRVLVEARRMGGLADGLDLDLEAERLAALLDGLAMAAATQPGRTTPALMRQILRRHLSSLKRQ
ncbi:TetR/AcrR family transcriptional regulator [Amycolatopsis nigrescens]|uniref:TetR/AcrR family transcriptional regulator n=1 Tax=Amycolatopsis nigrescens TaxID=381445 RepID=UPI00037C7FFC|nr:TetR/AcrR family transcriptional regulator [Amycolatopsis nigrescens]